MEEQGSSRVNTPFKSFFYLVAGTLGRNSLIGFGIFSGAYVLLGLFTVSVLDSDALFYSGLLQFLFSTINKALFFGLIASTSISFTQMHNRRNSALFHTLPVSQLHKFTIMLLYTFVLQAILYVFFTFLVNILLVLIFSASDKHVLEYMQGIYYTPAYFRELGTNGINIVLTFVFMNSMALFGAVFFRDKQLLKIGFLVTIVSIFLGTIIDYIGIERLLSSIKIDVELLLLIFMGLGSVLLVYLSYLIMKRHNFSKIKG